MNRVQTFLSVIILCGVITGMTIQEAEARTWFGRKNHHHRDYHPHAYGRVSFQLPRGFITIVLGGSRYHYYNGYYYRKAPYGYVTVAPPVGACIRDLPHGYTKFYVDVVVYYAYNDAYYQHTPKGYVVIEKPVSRQVKKIQHRESDTGVTINIPNKEGGYTEVILERSGDGYIGPQGEYYEEFPKVDHLKAIYGS